MDTIFYITATVVLASVFVSWLLHSRRDDTDNEKDRSGLILYTDHGTGVQYVGTILGGITPRLDVNGNVVVKK